MVMSSKSEKSVAEEAVKQFHEKRAEVEITSSDVSVDTVARWVERDIIDISPGFQRRDRWDDERRSRLIESFLINVPVPPVYLINSEPDKPYEVIDGKQRITAIFEFVSNEMPLTGLNVLTKLEGYKFSELNDDLCRTLSVEPAVRVVVVKPRDIPLLKQYDDESERESTVKFEVFHRLNTGGVMLDYQEIRNAIYRGPLNDLLIELAENKYMQTQLKVRENTAGFKVMKDHEYVLRFLYVTSEWKDAKFSEFLRAEELNKFMERYRLATSEDIAEFRSRYNLMQSRAEKLLGETAFRRWNPDTNIWRDQQNIALYDAESVALTELTEGEFQRALDHKDDVIKAIKDLFSNADFNRSISQSTAQIKAVRKRINFILEALRSA